MKNTIHRDSGIRYALVLGIILSHGPVALAGWTGSMNGTGFGKAIVNVTSSTIKTNQVVTPNVQGPSAAMKPTTGYTYGGALPSGASSATLARIKGLPGYIWQPTTTAANGDKTDNSELNYYVTPTSPLATTSLEVLGVTIETNSPACNPGEALYTFTWHWSGSDAGTAQMLKWVEYDEPLPEDFDGDVSTLYGANVLDSYLAYVNNDGECDGPCPTNFNRVVTYSVCGPADLEKFYLVTLGIAVSLPPPCVDCDGSTIVVDQNVRVDFNTSTPTCSGGALCDYVTYDKSAGPSPDSWKAVFDIGAARLLVKSNATITVNTVPLNTNNRRSPGLEIRSSCGVEVEEGAYVAVGSVNRQAGDILIQTGGDILINGVVSNSVSGTRGRPGSLTIGSQCGNISTGPRSKIITYGQDYGGSDINIASCAGGNIDLSGLVDASYKAKQASTINIAAFGGSVSIDGTHSFGTEVVAGTLRTVTGGVSVRSRRDPLPGSINIQADQDIVVEGSTLLSKKHPNYGAVAVKTASNGSKGGSISARALNGSLSAHDRAFDNANRYNQDARIDLQASGDIILGVISSNIDDGASTSVKPVVTVQAGDTGQGGKNILRSFNGVISMDAGTQVLANFAGRPGSDGANLLTSCGGVTLNSGVVPADADAGDDIGVCGGAPDPLLLDCSELGLSF